MAGICIICTKLEKKDIILDGNVQSVCHCNCGKYDKDKAQGFYTFNLILKQAKQIKDIQDNCENWDDSLKPKVN